jgi:hypothetical protein
MLIIFFILLHMEMAMYQCIISHHALCHHILYYYASCYIININLMVHMFCVKKGGVRFNMITWIKNFIDKYLNVCLLYYNC